MSLDPRPTLVCLLAGASLTAFAAGNARAEIPISLYSDVNYVVEHQNTTEHTFSLGGVDLFASQTVNRFSALAEVVLEADEASNSFGVDVERVEVGYQHAEWLRVRAGRFHTALGYYNDAFHHGRYFMVPTSRPVAVRFEDDGGLIPAHAVGLHIDGRFHLGHAATLRYDAELVNGRGPEVDYVANERDVNRSKAFNVRLRFEPMGVFEGLIVGANVYVDHIPPDNQATDTAAIHGLMNERILGAHAAYFEHNLHFISEFYAFRHEVAATGVAYNSTVFFVEAGYQVHDFTPYVRFELTHFAGAQDPFFVPQSAQGSYKVGLAGVKYTASENVALKLETSITDFDGLGVANNYKSVVQCAFAF